MSIYVARPRGFCAGVVRAIEIVEKALEVFGPPVYVRHEIVHNKVVCDALRVKGARFVEEISEVPPGSRVIFSAHGVSPFVKEEATTRNLMTIDATCPLVTKVHLEAIRYAKQGYQIILIGHSNHVEVQGTLGYAPEAIRVVGSVEEAEKIQVDDPSKLAFITQTTLSMDDMKAIIEVLQRRFPNIVAPKRDDICYATQNRQNAVKEVVKNVDLVLVVGDKKSSNANRLVEVARYRSIPAELIPDAASIQPQWLQGVKNVGVSAGASTPESVVDDVIRALKKMGFGDIIDIEVVEEHVTFPLPAELQKSISARSSVEAHP
jgi:4-hydroxy-3-methylbut-2-enyl diphosphate reductase